MPSGDYSAEFKQRFADRYADGATIAMLQHEFGLAKSTVKLWRERMMWQHLFGRSGQRLRPASLNPTGVM